MSLEAKLLRIDPEFLLELKLMEHVFGAGGLAFVKNKWNSQCMPAEKKPLSVTDALASSEQIKKSRVWPYLGMDAHGVIATAHDMLLQVSLGSPPCLGGVADEWLTSVHARLIGFASFPNEVGVKSDGDQIVDAEENPKPAETLYGLAALEKNLDYVLSADAQALKLHHFWYLSTFAQVLDAEKIVKMQAQLALVTARMDDAEPPVKQAATLSRAPTKKRKGGADVEVDAKKRAAALLA
eukprot:6459896-Amphidinium_carterae.3